MNSLSELLASRIFWEVIAGYWIFTAAVGALPTPMVGGPQLYMFVFRFGHILAGNMNRAAVALKVPGAQPDVTIETTTAPSPNFQTTTTTVSKPPGTP